MRVKTWLLINVLIIYEVNINCSLRSTQSSKFAVPMFVYISCRINDQNKYGDDILYNR